MINDIENKNSQKVMSDLEYAKNDTEMMRYRVNGLSYKLGLAAMICSLLGAFICLNSYSPRDFQVIMIIILNIIILLGGFMIWLGIIIILNNDSGILIAIGIIVLIAALLDIGLAVKFISFSFKNIKYMANRVAAERYSKITGNKIEEKK